MSGNERTIFGNGDGSSDGRMVTDTDLNAISVNVTRRAWEVPDYAKLLSYDLVNEFISSSYDAIFEGSASTGGRSSGTFTIGEGLRPTAPTDLGSALGAGMLGVWAQTGTITPPAQSGANNMLWAWMPGGTGTNHTAATTGYKRWDIVTCSVAEVSVATVSRDYEDAATGAKTSQDVVPAVVTTVTLSLTAGTESNSDAETIPAVPAGQHLLYAVHVDGTAIDDILDFTIPVGALRKVFQPGADGHFSAAAAWTLSPYGSAQSSAVSSDIVFYPPGLAGQGCARLLAMRICYRLVSGAVVTMESMALDGATSPATTKTITSSLTCDGNAQETLIDLRSSPLWGTGTQVKDNSKVNTSLALHVVTASTGATANNIYSVEWYFVG